MLMAIASLCTLLLVASHPDTTQLDRLVISLTQRIGDLPKVVLRIATQITLQ